MDEFIQTLKGYRPELQYSQLQPRNIDSDTLVRKSEGELMRTFQAKSLLGASLDQIQIDQLRVEQGKENALRMQQISTETHIPRHIVDGHVAEIASSDSQRESISRLGAHSDAAAADFIGRR